MTHPTPVTVAYGDGIGPEIMTACLKIMQAAGAQIAIDTIEVGERAYLNGHTSGIPASAWDSIHRTRVLYKAPITTPQGGGYKSLNVTIRKTLGLFANVRPAVSYFPAIDTRHPLMKVMIIRENEEDLYAGIEHRQTAEVYQTLKLITRPGSEKIIRYAFEYTRANNRKKLTCFTKDNIMKLTDGTFHKVFDEIAKEYPDIKAEHMIIDIGAARLADRPEKFDVIVVPNLYGDIVSDIAAQLTGSVGLGVSANIGEDYAMFEAIHGSAPDIAGQSIANPSGLLLAGVEMLVHIGQPEVAATINNAWKVTIEDGIHTPDIYHDERSTHKVSTGEFADAVIERLGKTPEYLRTVKFSSSSNMRLIKLKPQPRPAKALVGVDVFLDWDHDPRDPALLGHLLEERIHTGGLHLTMITNRGLKVYPGEETQTFCTDHWRCRFLSDQYAPITHQQLLELLGQFAAAGLDFIKTEHLYTFDGQPGFSLGQGE
ncbi:MAG: NADP-dependent isocitrate dehydrogenase [Anaerolineae bacterium]|jgi:isocitrate dehydrogenase|nr:NADP-dependent isocitrate dehydrogenase [Anaerolineae bacterium]